MTHFPGKGAYNMKKPFTKISALNLLAHVCYVALTALFFGITSLLEVPFHRGGLYIVFFFISIPMILFHPLFSYGFSIASIVSSAMALRKGERRGINILLIVLCALIILATTAGHAWFWWFCILNGA